MGGCSTRGMANSIAVCKNILNAADCKAENSTRCGRLKQLRRCGSDGQQTDLAKSIRKAIAIGKSATVSIKGSTLCWIRGCLSGLAAAGLWTVRPSMARGKWRLEAHEPIASVNPGCPPGPTARTIRRQPTGSRCGG
jgi:hypothetical protein